LLEIILEYSWFCKNKWNILDKKAERIHSIVAYFYFIKFNILISRVRLNTVEDFQFHHSQAISKDKAYELI